MSEVNILKINEALRELRNELGLTQKQMSQNVISTSFYSKVEQGISEIKAKDLFKLLNAHHINLSTFEKLLSEKEEISEQDLYLKEIDKTFYHHDRKNAHKLAVFIQKKEVSEYVKLLAILNEVDMTHSANKLPSVIQNKIKQYIFRDSKLSNLKLSLFRDSMGIFSTEDLLLIFRNILASLLLKNNLSIQTQNNLSVICLNLVFNLWLRKDLDHKEINLAFSELRKLPADEEHMGYKIVALYLRYLIYGQTAEAKNIKNMLINAGYPNLVKQFPK